MTTDLYIPPQAIEFEESVLSSCLLGSAEEAVELLKPSHFYRSSHQKVFSVIIDLVKNQVKVELPTVYNALRDNDNHAETGSAAYLAELIDRVPIASNVKHYATKIKEKAVLRELIKESNNIISACYSSNNTAESVLDDAQKRILNIEYEANNDAAVSYRDLAVDAEERYEDLYKRKGAITGIPSGFYMIDYLTCGFQKSDLIVIAGRPSIGKTALALNIAGNVGKKDIPVAFFSLEMSKDQLFDRQIAGESSVNSQKFRSGKFDNFDWNSINEAQSKIYSWPIFVDDSPALYYMEICRRSRFLKKKHGIKLIIIDHLQLVRGDKSSSRDREIGSITAGLKATAKELDLPIILLSQLNRKLEERVNPYKRPRLSDLRDSGNIEQDADVVAFLYRPVVYEDVEEFEGHAELNIAKARNGPVGMIKLRWQEKTTTFQNLETNY